MGRRQDGRDSPRPGTCPPWVTRRPAARDFAALLAGSAGSLKQQLAQGRSAFLSTLSSAAVNSAGTVLDAGIVSSNPRTAGLGISTGPHAATVRLFLSEQTRARDLPAQTGP